MKSKKILKVLCFILSLICIMGTFVLPSLADESDTNGTGELTEPVDKDYTYKMYFERLESFDTSASPKEQIASITPISLTDESFEGDFNSIVAKTFNEGEGLTRLRFKGWFLTDFGVEKYKVYMSKSGSVASDIIPYDTYNYLSENYLSDGLKETAEKYLFYDYAHNAHFDIDIDFSDFENCMIDITVVAVTRLGDEFSIIKLNNVPINSYHYDSCRYCGGSTYFSIVDPDLYSHVYHRSYYTCESCSKQTIVNENHSWNYFEERARYGCLSCGVSSQTGPDCTYWDINYTVFDSYYHEVRQSCDVCGDIMNLKAHQFTDGKCDFCGYELENINETETDETTDSIDTNIPSNDTINKDNDDKSLFTEISSYFDDVKGLFALFLIVDLILIIFVVVKAFKKRK